VDPHFPKLAYDASVRRLDKQDETVTELRARTGVVLATSALAASVLGRPALDARPAWLAALAVVAFAVSIVACLYVLLPRQNLVLSLIGPRVFEELYPFRADMAEVHRRLAYDLERFWQENDATIRRLVAALRIAAGALVAEIVLLLASLSGILG
jgi:hypothetical protein